jgi:hypothetical protein
MKLAMLIMLTMGRRTQMLRCLNIDSMKKETGLIEFVLEITDVKQGRPSFIPQPVLLKQFMANKKLCVFHYSCIYVST